MYRLYFCLLLSVLALAGCGPFDTPRIPESGAFDSSKSPDFNPPKGDPTEPPKKLPPQDNNLPSPVSIKDKYDEAIKRINEKIKYFENCSKAFATGKWTSFNADKNSKTYFMKFKACHDPDALGLNTATSVYYYDYETPEPLPFMSPPPAGQAASQCQVMTDFCKEELTPFIYEMTCNTLTGLPEKNLLVAHRNLTTLKPYVLKAVVLPNQIISASLIYLLELCSLRL